MMKSLYQGFMATLILAILCCGIYPAAVTGVGQLLFHDQANGKIILSPDGKPIGSQLIGQSFTKPEYFHSRPSSAGEKGYDATSSSGSNLGPTNQRFFDTVKSNVESFLKDNPTVKPGDVPVDAVTASGSGLDPQISPQNAFAQVDRVSQQRHVGSDQVRKLIEQNVNGPEWGMFGEPTVNVLALNIALDQKFPIRK